jgi:hypothetical protein
MSVVVIVAADIGKACGVSSAVDLGAATAATDSRGATGGSVSSVVAGDGMAALGG